MNTLFAGAPGGDHWFAVIGWLCIACVVCGPPLFVGGIIVVVHWAVSVRERMKKPQP